MARPDEEVPRETQSLSFTRPPSKERLRRQALAASGGAPLHAGDAAEPASSPTRSGDELQDAALAAITPEVVTDVLSAMIAEAKRGNVDAARVVLERALGPVADQAGDDELRKILRIAGEPSGDG